LIQLQISAVVAEVPEVVQQPLKIHSKHSKRSRASIQQRVELVLEC
jgi:hypothetical protein